MKPRVADKFPWYQIYKILYMLYTYTHTHTHTHIYIYIGSNVLSPETNIDTRLAKAWTAIDRLSVV